MTSNPSSAAILASSALVDADVQDAMQRIPGYLDITAEDFREMYQLAHLHAINRIFAGVQVRRLMQRDIQPLTSDLAIEPALHCFIQQDLKALPVIDAQARVIGILTETDVLRHLGVGDGLALLARVIKSSTLTQYDWNIQVSALMTTPAVTLLEEDGFAAIAAAFQRCPGRSLPVVNTAGQLRGLLLRKQFVAACHLEGALA